MDQESWTHMPLGAKAHKHHVEAEDLHVSDALLRSPCIGNLNIGR